MGCMEEWVLSEPIPSGEFKTSLGVARSDSELYVSCELSAHNPEHVVAPLTVDPKCPRVLREIVSLPLKWRLGSTPVKPSYLPGHGREEGVYFAQILQDKRRVLPVVAIAQHYGEVIHAGVSEQIARDLVGLAVVVELDDDAAWELTRTLGKEWSCYNGAIRLYWPFASPERNPYRHPLWTSLRLLSGVSNSREAAHRIRYQLRSMLFAVSTFSIPKPDLFRDIERSRQEEDRQARHKEAVDHDDFRLLAELYSDENEGLRSDIESLQDENKELREQLYYWKSQSLWQDNSVGNLEPVTDTPPSTVTEAVAQARRQFTGQIRFGRQVDESIEQLNPEAGPPDKVFDYLAALAELSEIRSSGPLGNSMLQWLSERGVSVSAESETTRKNKREMLRRTWDDGVTPREFDLHLKPSEGTSPDRCVRIYFDWDDTTKRIVVGYVGRHL
jgi:hypothetical protein